MALWISNTQRALVKKGKDDKDNLTHRDKYSTANLSTSRSKGNGEKGYLYSEWGFARFVGKAHQYVMENVKDGDLIVLEKAIMTNEAYMDKETGERKYPKKPNIVVFECSLYQSDKRKSEENNQAEIPPEDDIPF